MIKTIEIDTSISTDGYKNRNRLTELAVAPNQTRNPAPQASIVVRKRDNFDKRLARVFAKVRSKPGPYAPIPRRRLARMLGCPPSRIRTIEEKFKRKLMELFRELDCVSTTDANRNR